MKPFFDCDGVALHHGDCSGILPLLSESSVDSIVTDPPYGLKFMGKEWDHGVPGELFWAEALRVAKPGAHLLAFGGTRTYHRLVCAIEDAGWEIRDCIMWVYGSGFPKSLDVSKAIDKAAGAEREVVGRRTDRAATPKQDIRGGNLMNGVNGGIDCSAITAPATESAKQWDGWGTALKPAYEPIIVARKPLVGTVARNVQEYGTGAINIDGCRIETNENLNGGAYSPNGKSGPMAGDTRTGAALGMFQPGAKPDRDYAQPPGRFPANLIHDGSDEVLALFPDSKGQQGDVRGNEPSGVTDEIYGKFAGRVPSASRGDSGSAARFFYCAKASKSDRTMSGKVVNKHPTVKPNSLMRYLCRLVTQPGGVVLDPFCGSGSTGVAAVQEGFRFIGVERDECSVTTARERIKAVVKDDSLPLFSEVGQ